MTDNCTGTVWEHELKVLPLDTNMSVHVCVCMKYIHIYVFFNTRMVLRPVLSN